MDRNDIIKKVFNIEGRQRDGRIWAWDICYSDFQAIHEAMKSRGVGAPTPKERDKLSRSLALYLASWGMYRGSGKLLFANYHRFDDAIDILLNDDHWQNRNSLEGKDALYRSLCNASFSHLAAQKILSGVFGCNIPLDEMCFLGIQACGLSQDINRKQLVDTVALADAFAYSGQNLGRRPKGIPIVDYPRERLADVFYWWVGFCVTSQRDLQSLREKGKAPSRNKTQRLADVFNVEIDLTRIADEKYWFSVRDSILASVNANLAEALQ